MGLIIKNKVWFLLSILSIVSTMSISFKSLYEEYLGEQVKKTNEQTSYIGNASAVVINGNNRMYYETRQRGNCEDCSTQVYYVQIPVNDEGRNLSE